MENKRKIDEYISKAIDALETNQKIVKNGKISKAFSGQIATFAVAVSTSSLLSAVAFFTESGDSKVERSELMNVIYKIVQEGEAVLEKNSASENDKADNNTLLGYVKQKYGDTYCKKKLLDYRKVQEDILNAAIATKLAMNFYQLVDKDDKRKEEVSLNAEGLDE